MNKKDLLLTPELGGIKRASEIGLRGVNKYIWHACDLCGKQRWTKIRFGLPEHTVCLSCASSKWRGDKNHYWKGGRFLDKYGYAQIYVDRSDFFYPMANKKNRVPEHRLVMAKALGRCLQSWEIVHHKEGFAKDDNRYPETLQLVTDDRHKQITLLETRIARLEKRITLLGAENCLLKEKQNVG